MAVDLKLNEMVNQLDAYLAGIDIEDVELSCRAKIALREAGAKTLRDAEVVLIRRNMGGASPLTQRTAKEVDEIVSFISREFCVGRRQNWQPIETAPKEVYLLCSVVPPASEVNLHEAIFGERPEPFLRLVIARRKKGDPRNKVREAVNGRLRTATHWQPLPDLPVIEE
jgi:hypothetical protein